jgi:hypothetical protein
VVIGLHPNLTCIASEVCHWCAEEGSKAFASRSVDSPTILGLARIEGTRNALWSAVSIGYLIGFFQL